MAQAPSPETCARRILKVFLKFNCKAGGVLRPANFFDPFEKLGWGTEDFNGGVAHALQNGWIEKDTPYSYRLTAAGFAEAE
jgi:hypothetical protein